jgi:hypothetical protein
MEKPPEKPARRSFLERVYPPARRKREFNERVADLLRRRRDQLQRIASLQAETPVHTAELRYRMITNFALEEIRRTRPRLEVPEVFRETVVAGATKVSLRPLRSVADLLDLTSGAVHARIIQDALAKMEKVIGPIKTREFAQAFGEQSQIITEALDRLTAPPKRR